MKTLFRKVVWASFCLLFLPMVAFADGVVIDSCGRTQGLVNNQPKNGVCVLAGGNMQYQAQVNSGVNHFQNIASPVEIHGLVGANNFVLTVSAATVWTRPGPVFTFMRLDGTATLQPGATVTITLTGTLGGPALEIKEQFANNGNAQQVFPFSDAIFGPQAIAAAAVMRLEVNITGNATVVLPNSAEFQGEIPEPATLFLLGTGLAGVAMRMRRTRFRKR